MEQFHSFFLNRSFGVELREAGPGSAETSEHEPAIGISLRREKVLLSALSETWKHVRTPY